MKSSDKPQAAVVGLGIGMAHVAGYLASNDVELVAVADAWEPRRQRVGGTFGQGSMKGLENLFDPAALSQSWESLGIRVFPDIGPIIDDPDIGIVSLCTPDDTHEDLAVRVLASGKDLLLEKPIALSVSAAKRIADTAARNGRRLAVGYEMRVNPAVLKLRELVTNGDLGEIHAFNLQQYRTPFRRDKWEKWIQRREHSGGLIVEETCHWIDLARYLTSREISCVQCVSNDRINTDFDYEDIAFLQGSFDDGAIFQIGHSLTGFDFSLTIQLHGTRGSAWCGLKAEPRSMLDAGQTHYLGVVSWGPVPGSSVSPADFEPQTVTFGEESREGNNIMENVVRFTRAIVTGSALTADAEDGIRSLEVALAAGRAARTGKPEVI